MHSSYMNYREKKSDFKSLDYRSINFSGNWSKHFINNYVDSMIKLDELSGGDRSQFTKEIAFRYIETKNLPCPLFLFEFEQNVKHLF